MSEVQNTDNEKDFELEVLTEVKDLPTPKKRGGNRSKRKTAEVKKATQLMLFEKLPGKIPSIKDDIASMEFSFFSVSPHVDTTPYEYTNGQQKIRIVPSAIGRPNQQFDKDLMLYINSLMARADFKNKDDHLIYRRIVIDLADFCRFSKREFDGTMSEMFMNALLRLRGTTIQTSIRTTSEDELINGFSLIESYEVLKRSKGKRQGVLSAEVTLSKWQASQIRDRYLLTIDEDYFKIKRPTDLRLYEIARKFCGTQMIMFFISVTNLMSRMGFPPSKSLKYFRYQLRDMVQRNVLPKYHLAFDSAKDMLVIFPRELEVTKYFRELVQLGDNPYSPYKTIEQYEEWFMGLLISEEADPYKYRKYLARQKKD